MTSELIKEDKPNTIKLGDKEYELSPINWNVMSYIEEEFGCKFSDFGKYIKGATSEVSIMRTLLYIFLRDDYPDLTITELGKLITVENMGHITDAIGIALYGKGYKDLKKITTKPKKKIK